MGSQFVIYGNDITLMFGDLHQLIANGDSVKAATKGIKMPARDSIEG